MQGSPTTRLKMLWILTLLAGSASADVLRLSEPVLETATFEVFGATWVDEAPRSLAEVMQTPAAYVDRQFVMQSRVAQVCQKKGCFFIAQEGAHAIRVSFKDYGFFIPTDTSGKVVVLAGELKRRELSEDEAAHFKADTGDANAPMKAGPVYELVASGVRIPK